MSVEILKIPDHVDKAYVDNWAKKHKNVAGTITNIIKKRDFIYITPGEMFALQKTFKNGERKLTLAQLIKMAKRADNGRKCDVCGQLNVWEFGECEMCFPCTTGETDPSDDFEMTMHPLKKPHYKGNK